jgi:hypothetical protein
MNNNKLPIVHHLDVTELNIELLALATWTENAGSSKIP